MTTDKSVTIRLGPLTKGVFNRIKSTKETVSNYIRRLVATDLGETPPEMKGFIDTIERFNRERKAKQDSQSPRKKTIDTH